jgi:hypothetical protein
MDDAFTPSLDNYPHFQHSGRSNTRSGNGYRESESNSSRRNPRDGRGGKPPYEGGEDYNCGSKEDFDPGDKMPQGDDDKQRQQEIDNDEEEDKAFHPEGGCNYHNTRSTGQPYNIPPWGQQQPITPNARVLQPTAFAATPTTPPAASAPAYSGLDKMLVRGGADQETTKTMTKLKWQATIAKDKDKIKKFLKNVLQVRRLHAFLFMTKDSCFVQMAHSVAKFATVNPIAGEVDRKIFGFIGNR